MSTYRGYRTMTTLDCTNEQVKEWLDNPVTKEIMLQCKQYNAEKDHLNLGDSAPDIFIGVQYGVEDKKPILHFFVG